MERNSWTQYRYNFYLFNTSKFLTRHSVYAFLSAQIYGSYARFCNFTRGYRWDWHVFSKWNYNNAGMSRRRSRITFSTFICHNIQNIHQWSSRQDSKQSIQINKNTFTTDISLLIKWELENIAGFRAPSVDVKFIKAPRNTNAVVQIPGLCNQQIITFAIAVC